MSIELGVDVAALYDMAGRLKGLRQEFDAAGDVAVYSGVEHHELQGALHQFAANWSDKRRKIGEMIDDVAGCVENAGRAYEEAEQSIADAYGPGGGGGKSW
jgi:hypothetical protein